MVKRRVVTLNLDLEKIDSNVLEEIASRIEEKIRELLSESLVVARSYDADIIVSLEKKEDRIDVSIDIEVGGELGDVVDYDTVLQGVMKEVSKFVEQELRRFTKKEVSGKNS